MISETGFLAYVSLVYPRKMPVNVLFIGDPHIQIENLPEVDLLIEGLINLATERQPDLICIAGDLLHTHERLHTIALNKACEMVDNMRLIAPTYVLVGNHDYIQNQQFLTENHWMTGLKEWSNTTIVDCVVAKEIDGELLIFVPYVPPGRFEDALNTYRGDWKKASVIFAHQEFCGCKMGAIISVEGDKWPLDYPCVVSGHIHSRQTPQENVYYSGAAMQHAFGESEKNVIAVLAVSEGSYKLEEVDLGLPRKKIVYMDVDELDTYEVPSSSDKVRITVSGDYDQFKAAKKTGVYKKLVGQGVKVVFKAKKPKKTQGITDNTTDNATDTATEDGAVGSSSTDFAAILQSMVLDRKDRYLMQAYDLVVNNRDTALDDVIFFCEYLNYRSE